MEKDARQVLSTKRHAFVIAPQTKGHRLKTVAFLLFFSLLSQIGHEAIPQNGFTIYTFYQPSFS